MLTFRAARNRQQILDVSGRRDRCYSAGKDSFFDEIQAVYLANGPLKIALEPRHDFPGAPSICYRCILYEDITCPTDEPLESRSRKKRCCAT